MGGTVKHPTLQKFLIEANLYEKTGLNLDDLMGRPIQEAIDYVTIIGLMSHEKVRQQKLAEAKNNRGVTRR